ncbi:MAG TPA: tetratricopeptide repeat protein [Leptolyngbyaceae cyanobacterium]
MRRQIRQNPDRRLVRSLLKWFQALLKWVFPSSTTVNKGSRNPSAKPSQIEIVKPLTDKDYEFLFLQLLEGVAHGWDSARVGKFLADLNKRTSTNQLVNWLQISGKNSLENSPHDRQLAKQMILLGELDCGELGKISQQIGENILTQVAASQIQEIEPTAILPISSYSNQSNILNKTETPTIEIVSQSEILRLLNDENLAEAMRNFLAMDSRDIQAEIWLNQANQQYIQQNLVAAVSNYEKVLSIQPNNHDAWYNKALALKDLGFYEEAIASYDQALNLLPNCPDTWNNRGAVLRNLERYAEAVINYDKALELNQNKYETWYNRGISLFKLGKIQEAILSYDRALQLEPKSHEIWNNKGNALRELAQYEEAIDCYDKALFIKPDKVESWNNRGTVLFSLERFEEAIFNYEKALEFKPDLSEAWHNRGNALKKLGREAEAQLSYDRALESSN